MIPLPPIQQLINRCRALAALDLILSPDWQYRYYSFNSLWSKDELMASMRDGCGDEWWIVFHRNGSAALKGLGHESPAWRGHRQTLSNALHHSFPAAFKGFATEPAFRWDETTFAYFYSPGGTNWTRVNDLAGYPSDDTGEAHLLAHVVGGPSDYANFASDYYETKVDKRIVEAVFALQPITAEAVGDLNPSTSLGELAKELYGEIQYPQALS